MEKIWRGWIIDKSLKDKSTLSGFKVIKSQEEENNNGDEKQIWVLYTVEIEEKNVEKVAKVLEKQIKLEYYAHFTNGRRLLIVFHNKYFLVNLEKYGKDEGDGITSFKAKLEDRKLWKLAFKYAVNNAKIDPRYLLEVK